MKTTRRRFLKTMIAGATIAPQLPGILARATEAAPILPITVHDCCGCSIINLHRGYVGYSSFEELSLAVPAGRDVITERIAEDIIAACYLKNYGVVIPPR